MINQPTDVEKQKYYNTNGTQTGDIEEEKETTINDDDDDDMEIVPDNALQDDFVQLDINECNDQQPKVNLIKLFFLFLNKNFVFVPFLF